MYGQHVESLSVITSASGGYSTTTVWTKSGNQDQRWHFAQVNLPAQQELHVCFSYILNTLLLTQHV